MLPHPVLAVLTSLLASAAAAALAALAWQGRLGMPALLLLAVAVAAHLATRRLAPTMAGRLDGIAKGVFTILGLLALLRHPIALDDGAALPVYEAIARYIATVDPQRFVVFALAAMAIKLAGVVSSAYAWHLLLVGQGIRFPFWSKIMTSFLIGRFIGTFLPSTLGLDGYTLYEASRYSNQWSRAVTAKALEKVIGVAGLFVGMTLTLPFGYSVIVDVTQSIGRPQTAPLLAAAIGTIAGGISLTVVAGLVRPGLLTALIGLAGRAVPHRLAAPLGRFEQSVAAYRGQLGLLLFALLCKFAAHFATAVVYFFTALAIGVTGAQFWPITFGSTIQILATVLSPTIAGEGAREAFQALLLSKQLGGVPQAVLSAALGFLAAEAATLWGGAFMWTRTPKWRPRFSIVDGQQVDYAWIVEDSVTRPGSGGKPAA